MKLSFSHKACILCHDDSSLGIGIQGHMSRSRVIVSKDAAGLSLTEGSLFSS